MLREVEARGTASTAELVAATGLHENTVRGHLEQLHRDGHLDRETVAPAGRGRPAIRWRAVDAHASSPYAELAITLADTLAHSGPSASTLARRAGLDWGARLARERTATATPSEPAANPGTDTHAAPPAEAGARRDPHAVVTEIMREQGFAPHPADDDALELRRCPLLAASSRQPAIVCAMHEGMIEGIARTCVDGARAEIEPFVADGVCLLRVRTAAS